MDSGFFAHCKLAQEKSQLNVGNVWFWFWFHFVYLVDEVLYIADQLKPKMCAQSTVYDNWVSAAIRKPHVEYPCPN